MALPKRLLGADEHIVFHLRTHIKRILGWLLLGVLLIAAAIAGSIFMPKEAQPIGNYIVWGLCVVLLVPVVIVPWLNWLTNTYTITDRRIITRTGIFNKRGHDIPLSRISNVSYDRSLVDRMFRCGTLILETSAENPVHLDDIPRIEQVHVRMTELLFNAGQGGNRTDA
ncbi:PH domain-containing protein [Gulosibacter bifidus]|uniref:PH domain-containing protein n=1 Tax=Gulosibacter bifidus TaxID=272239 RepID=A0ABW5RFY2_9MICO|nr:PH domain-containing protein [Gulosibacter bifidus]